MNQAYDIGKKTTYTKYDVNSLVDQICCRKIFGVQIGKTDRTNFRTGSSKTFDMELLARTRRHFECIED